MSELSGCCSYRNCCILRCRSGRNGCREKKAEYVAKEKNVKMYMRELLVLLIDSVINKYISCTCLLIRVILNLFQDLLRRKESDT
jgi:hypothetical protein